MVHILLIIVGGIIILAFIVLFVNIPVLSTLYRNTPLMIILTITVILFGIYAYATGHSEEGYGMIISAILGIIIVIVRRQEEGTGKGNI